MARGRGDSKSGNPRRLLRGDHLVEPPAGTVRRAVALGERLRRPDEGIVGWIVERLFDSAAAPLPAGVRGAPSERRLLYELRPDGGGAAGQLDLSVRSGSRGTRRVTGQLLPPIPDATVVVGRRRARVAATGEFSLAGLPASGAFQIQIRIPDGPPIVLPAVDDPGADGDNG